MNDGQLFRYAAFTTVPTGGNPAGVWVGDVHPDEATMQRIAAEVGYSETAFIAPATGMARTVRYFSPKAEVPFCGHATIAAGIVLGEQDGEGRYRFATPAGEVPVDVQTRDGRRVAAHTPAATRHAAPDDALLDGALAALRWGRGELDPAIPPARAYAGAWHLVLAVRRRERLAALDYDFGALLALMLARDLTTLQLAWREDATVFHARDPFPVGGVVEDPATGAAAAALGGYLRDAGIVSPPVSLTIHQGVDMGRPSLIAVDVPPSGGIVVRGSAVPIAPP